MRVRYPPPSEEEAAAGARMRLVRTECRIDRRSMAQQLTISADQLNRFERGLTSLRLRVAWDFCELTNTDPRWLAFGEPYPRLAFGMFGRVAAEEASLLFVPRMREMQHGNRLKVRHDDRPPSTVERARLKFLASLQVKQYLSSMPVTEVITPSWDELREWLVEATAAPGAKAALAREFKVQPAAVSQWLSGATAPTAATTLRLLKWVTAEGGHMQQKERAGSVSPPSALKTRTDKSKSNENPKSGQPQK